MKKSLLIVLFLFSSLLIFAQQVELLLTTDEVYENPRRHDYGEFWPGPTGMYVDEVKNEIVIQNYMANKEYHITNNSITEKKELPFEFRGTPYILRDYVFGILDNNLTLSLRNSIKMSETINTGAGISFILKKGDGYLIYYVDKTGKPGAVDTEGTKYSNIQAMDYLKTYDSVKYAESLARAKKLGLQQQFQNNEVLIWGQTYYSTLYILTEFWTGDKYNPLFAIIGSKFHYDLGGYAYQIGNFSNETVLVIVDQNGRKLFEPFHLEQFSQQDPIDTYPSTLWYVGFGGNIYYYVAGEDYTEVFRIRRTWGEPDFYAMAINGYTDDDYGAYVNEVLAGLSKADLRLLRNTVFALYGYHFNSADLAAHFDKQVWYTDEGKTTGDITLPAHRALLVEMIQALETQ